VKRKVLYSPGYGAGWVSWASGSKEFKQWMLTYQPIIDFLEAGGDGSDLENHEHPITKQFLKEAKERFGEKSVYMGGADDLQVAEVEGEVYIEEYDGFESLKFRYDSDGWL
jgi:hypothetical protein